MVAVKTKQEAPAQSRSAEPTCIQSTTAELQASTLEQLSLSKLNLMHFLLPSNE